MSRGQISVPSDIKTALYDLIARGLVHRNAKTNRYDLHPIVRRYAYDRLTAAGRADAHACLRDYFAAIPAPVRVQTLDDLAPVIELYYHTVCAGQLDEAFKLFHDRIDKVAYYQFGAYQLQIELLRALFPDGEDKPPRLKDENAQVWTLNSLASSYSLSGQPRQAVPLFEEYTAISEKRGDKRNLAIGLGNVASMAQIHIGALRAAEAILRRRIILCREIEDAHSEAIGHAELGRLLTYQGIWEEADDELATALAMFEKENSVPDQGYTWAYRALHALLMQRAVPPLPLPRSPLSAAQRALELADEWARTQYPMERDYVRDHWLLGAAHRVSDDLDAADSHLSEAITRCRRINVVEFESDILLELARLRRQGDKERVSSIEHRASSLLSEAKTLAEEALIITERAGYVLQGADVHLFLAQLALDMGERDVALEHARKAQALATCDGSRNIYKIAYREAEALITEITGDKQVMYRLFITAAKQATVGEHISVKVQFVPTLDGNNSFKISNLQTEIYCFISANGLYIQGSEVVPLFLDTQVSESPFIDFKLEAYLCGERTFTVEVFAEDPQSGSKPLVKTSGQITVSPPTIHEGPSPILTALEIQVAAHPDFTLRAITEFVGGKDSTRCIAYYLASRLPGLWRGEKLVGRVVFSAADMIQVRELFSQAMCTMPFSQPEDTRTRMLSLGTYLFNRLFPTEEAAFFHEALRKAAGRLHTWLIVEDGVTWLPWELLVHDWGDTGQPQFLGEQFCISRWIAGLGPKPYSEIPLGEIALAHYRYQEPGHEAEDEVVEGWRRLLIFPFEIEYGIENRAIEEQTQLHNVTYSILPALKAKTLISGLCLHVLRHVDSFFERRGMVVKVPREKNTPDSSENEVNKVKLDVRLKRPVITLGMYTEKIIHPGTFVEEWLLPERALPFVRAGASAVIGPWWPTSEAADRIFWPTFYNLLLQRVPLGESVWRARLAVRDALSQRPDWLAYTLFGDPLAEPYWPELSEGYTALECLSNDDPLIVGKTYHFRASIRSRPPVWYQDRLIDVEALPQDPQVMFLAPRILDEIPEPVKMEPAGRTMVQAIIELTPQEEGQLTLIARLFDGDERLQVLRLQLRVSRQKETR